jgi:uncharacterized protein YjdB
MLKFYRSALMAGVVALGLAACGDDVTVAPPSSGSGGVSSVTVAPTSATVTVGSSILLTANVIADSGKTGVTWVSSDQTVATVDASGRVTGVAVGNVTVVATSTANTAISGAAAVAVVQAPPGVNSFTLTPTSVTLALGQSATIVPNFSLAPGVTAPTVTWASLTPTVATVDQTGKITAVACTGGATCSAVVTGAITVGGVSETQAVAVTVTSTTPASISIQEIDAGAGQPGAGLPVTLTNVKGQIDVKTNLTAGTAALDSMVLYVKRGNTFVTAAKQNFGGTVPSTGLITLSINTANFSKDTATGVARVDYVNGPTTLLAKVFATGSNSATDSVFNCQTGAGDQTCSVVNSIVLNNSDGWAADLTKPLRSASDSGGANANVGKTYWGGPNGAATVDSGAATAILYPVVYDDNPTSTPGSALNRCGNQNGDGTDCISTVTWTLGSTEISSGHCPDSTQTAQPFKLVYGSTGPDVTLDCSTHQNVLSRRDNIIINSGVLDAQSNSFPNSYSGSGSHVLNLIPNTVVFGATPDSMRLDWAGPSAVQRPTGQGWEEQHWVNATWQFNHDGTGIADGGVGPAPSSWTAYVGPDYTTVVHSGADLAETNTNTTDGYSLQATGADRLGNTAQSAVGTTFGVDKTAPALRYSGTASPSSYAAIYTGGGTAAVLDSTTYNAVQGLYGASVVTPGAQDLFLAATAGTNDSFRIEALDSRSGLYRGIETVNRFAQGGATGTTTSVLSVNFTIDQAADNFNGFLPATIDGWLPLHAEAVTGGDAAPGYYTTTGYVVDKAGNASGCPVTRAADGVNGGACTAAAAGASNAFARRTLALDPGQPQVTGVSPNNNYAGNMPVVFTLGSQNDLEVIDAKLRLQYPNLTIGDNAGTVPAAGGLVWTYALSNTVLAASPNGNTYAGPASGTGANIGYFMPIALRFDNSIINPSITPLTLDMFTDNVQETCTGTTGHATGPTTASDCGNTAYFVGDPIPTDEGGIPLAIPTSVGVQVRDVFGSWIFNTTASPVTGVSDEFVSPILSATVQTPVTTFGVSYVDPGNGQACPAGGAVQAAGSATCVSGGINFRADGFYSTASTKVFRATEPFSESLPTFDRVDLFGLNAQQQWVFIARITVPNPISVGASCPAVAPSTTGVVGCDNGLERYWLYTFTSVPGLPFTEYRAIGVDANGSGLASTINP